MGYVELREGLEEVRIAVNKNLVPEAGTIIHRFAEGIGE